MSYWDGSVNTHLTRRFSMSSILFFFIAPLEFDSVKISWTLSQNKIPAASHTDDKWVGEERSHIVVGPDGGDAKYRGSKPDERSGIHRRLLINQYRPYLFPDAQLGDALVVWFREL